MRVGMRMIAAAVAVWTSCSALPALAADTYAFDLAHSSIEFSVKHMVISNVKGTFDRFDGTLVADAEDLGNSSVEVIIETASINTRNDKRDEHLRSADFLDAENHPQITFRSAEIRQADAGYVALGTLTIRGVAKEVALPFTVNGPITNPWGQTVIGIEIAYELDRQDYGVNWSQTMDNGGLVVGDTVRIEINLEAQKQP